MIERLRQKNLVVVTLKKSFNKKINFIRLKLLKKISSGLKSALNGGGEREKNAN